MTDRVPAFLEDDRVEKPTRAGVERGVVVALTSRAGARFLMVWILDGPRKNSREYPEKGWRALLDYDGPSNLSCRCLECERTFRAPDHQRFCRTCARATTPGQRPRRDAEPATWTPPVHRDRAELVDARPLHTIADDEIPF